MFLMEAKCTMQADTDETRFLWHALTICKNIENAEHCGQDSHGKANYTLRWIEKGKCHSYCKLEEYTSAVWHTTFLPN